MYDVKTHEFHLLPEAPVMTGVKELMQLMKEDGLTIGVVTGSGQRPLINRLLVDFGDYLDEKHITTAYDVSRGKPAADPYLMGMKKCNDCEPWETVVVENAPLGVQAGAASQALTGEWSRPAVQKNDRLKGRLERNLSIITVPSTKL